jgi:hypothetical protein
MHSATKFFGGHADLLPGSTVAADPAVAVDLRHGRELAGATPGALEVYLALRGIRTLAVRLDWAQRSAHGLARRLADDPAVTRSATRAWPITQVTSSQPSICGASEQCWPSTLPTRPPRTASVIGYASSPRPPTLAAWISSGCSADSIARDEGER